MYTVHGYSILSSLLAILYMFFSLLTTYPKNIPTSSNNTEHWNTSITLLLKNLKQDKIDWTQLALKLTTAQQQLTKAQISLKTVHTLLSQQKSETNKALAQLKKSNHYLHNATNENEALKQSYEKKIASLHYAQITAWTITGIITTAFIGYVIYKEIY